MAIITVDVSDLMDTINKLESLVTQERFNEIMRRTFIEAGRKTKTIVARNATKDYEASYGWVASQVGWPIIGAGGGQVSVVVPIKGKRGSIGGTFPASGGRRSKRGYRLKMRTTIVKGQRSLLPPTMPHQGDQPPFMIGGVGFTRKYKGRPYPIVHVVGIGVPQMPLNLSRPGTEKDLHDYIEKRLEHHIMLALGIM